MRFEDAVIEECRLHKFVTPQDLVKLAYQSTYGKEHLLSDNSVEFFYSEFDSVEPTEEKLYEEISDNAIRVNLGAWKHERLDPKWLLNLFLLLDVEFFPRSEDVFLLELRRIRNLIVDGNIKIDLNEWDEYVDNYMKEGIRPLHHSEVYRVHEHPHYRLLPAFDIKAIKVLLKVVQMNAHIIAIEGRSASGKSTLADRLKIALEEPAIHMDDFFLPYHIHSNTRHTEPKGNVHYERFIKEVLPHLRSGEEFNYGRYNHETGKIDEVVTIPSSPYRIVEGSYSTHPTFGKYYDLFIFTDVFYPEQIRRLINREGKDNLDLFIKKWIPMEERYFTFYNIRGGADLIL